MFGIGAATAVRIDGQPLDDANVQPSVELRVRGGCCRAPDDTVPEALANYLPHESWCNLVADWRARGRARRTVANCWRFAAAAAAAGLVAAWVGAGRSGWRLGLKLGAGYLACFLAVVAHVACIVALDASHEALHADFARDWAPKLAKFDVSVVAMQTAKPNLRTDRWLELAPAGCDEEAPISPLLSAAAKARD